MMLYTISGYLQKEIGDDPAENPWPVSLFTREQTGPDHFCVVAGPNGHDLSPKQLSSGINPGVHAQRGHTRHSHGMRWARTTNNLINLNNLYWVMVSEENRIRLRKDVLKALRMYISENGKVVSGVPGVTIDENKAVSEIVMNFLAGKGYYPPKPSKEV